MAGREAVVEAGEEIGEFEASEEAEEGTEDSLPGLPPESEEMKAGGSGSLKRILYRVVEVVSGSTQVHRNAEWGGRRK